MCWLVFVNWTQLRGKLNEGLFAEKAPPQDWPGASFLD